MTASEPLAWDGLAPGGRVLDLDTALVGVRTVDAVPVPGAQARLGEHPFWSQSLGGVVWVDIDAGEVRLHRPEVGNTVLHRARGPIGAALPEADGTLLVAGADGLVRLDPLAASTTPVAPAPPAGLRFNDAGLAPDGVVWAGVLPLVDPPAGERPTGYIDRIDPAEGQPHTALTVMGCPNGIVWTPDGSQILVCESDTRQIAAAAYTDGQASDWHVVLSFTGAGDAVPDGLDQLSDGRLWVAFWGLGVAVLLAADGEPELVIRTPDERTTSMCTGPDGTVWVTTAAGLCRARV
ncbi:MAG: SMP-30/gluconolactonase/LRE family protein [Cellulomonas sp.]|nr:SMP-30/gluconolactonase/LRE family protein [Cellulomonas sp.]